MWDVSIPGKPGALRQDEGCAYPLDGHGAGRCGAPRRLPSSYCPHHHALCHVGCGTKAEAHLLREVEALASAVGGRRARDGGGPSKDFLKRLEQAARVTHG
jgi:hypothetical protein